MNTTGNKIKLTSSTEVRDIKKKFPRKAHGLDMLTADIVCEMPKKAFVMLSYIFNAALRILFYEALKNFELLCYPSRVNHSKT